MPARRRGGWPGTRCDDDLVEAQFDSSSGDEAAHGAAPEHEQTTRRGHVGNLQGAIEQVPGVGIEVRRAAQIARGGDGDVGKSLDGG